MNWRWVVAGVGSLALAVWAVVATDGAYFGSGFVRFVYQQGARWWSYPTNDTFRAYDTAELIPLLESANEARQLGWVLDVATGTGRVPLLLTRDAPWFRGAVAGVDLAPNMLRRAFANLSERESASRCLLAVGRAERLPVRDGIADAVTCIEAFTNFGRPRRALAEMARALAPGGTLILCKPSDRYGQFIPGKAVNRRELARRLVALGFDPPDFVPYSGSHGRSELMVARKAN